MKVAPGKPYVGEESRRRRPMRLNLIQTLHHAAVATTSIVTTLFAAELGASNAQLGFIGATYGLATFASHWVFGRAADRFDRRAFVLWGTLGAAAAQALAFFAFDVPGLVAARFLAGFAVGVFPAALAVFVYDLQRPLGKFSSFGALGWSLGAGVVALVALALPGLGAERQYRLLYLLAALPLLACFLVARALPSMRAGLRVPFLPASVLRGSASVYVPMLMRHTGATAIWVIFPLYILDLGGDLAYVGVIHLANVAAQFVVLQNVERLPGLNHPRVLVPIGLLTSAGTFVAFALSRTVHELLAWQLLLGVSWSTLWLGSLKQCLETNVERATATGLLNSSVSLSNIAGPLLGGLLAAVWGFEATMWFAAGMSLAAMPVHRALDAWLAPRPAAIPQEAPK